MCPSALGPIVHSLSSSSQMLIAFLLMNCSRPRMQMVSLPEADQLSITQTDYHTRHVHNLSLPPDV